MADAHGCPACPHPSLGPAISGSPTVMINKRPALRVDDTGVHAACCGPNMWTATSGSPNVFFNGKAAHRLNDGARHCGGSGQLIEASTDVLINEGSGGGAGGGGGSGSGSGSSGGGGSSGGQAATSDSSSAPASAATAAPPATQAAPAAPAAAQPAPQPAQDKPVEYRLHVQLQAHGGTPLAYEPVRIVEAESRRLVDTATSDENGVVSVDVPEEKDYEVVADLDTDDRYVHPWDSEARPRLPHTTLLCLEVRDAAGRPLAGERVAITPQSGTAFTSILDDDGRLRTAVEQGPLTISVRGHRFAAHSIELADLDERGRAAYRFRLPRAQA